MATKEITTLQRKTRAIEDAAKINQQEATAALAERFPLPEEELPESDSPSTLLALDVPVPDWGSLQDFIARELEVSRLRMEKAANDYSLELRDDRRRREGRDAVVQEVYQNFLRARHILEEAIGEPVTYELLGVDGTTPQQPVELLRLVRIATQTLKDPERLPVDLRLPGMTLSWTDLAAALEDDAARLEGVLTEQREEGRIAELALIRRERVQAEVNDAYVGFTRVLEGLYVAASRRELAERLRLNLRNGSSGSDPEPEDDEPQPVPPPQPPGGPDPDGETGEPGDENPGGGQGQGQGEDLSDDLFPVAAVASEDSEIRPIVALPPDAEIPFNSDS